MELVVQAIPNQPEEGTLVTLRVEPPRANADFDYQWTVSGGSLQEEGDQRNAKEVHWDTTGMRAGTYRATVEATPKVDAPGEPKPKNRGEIEIVVAFRPSTNSDGIALNRTPNPLTGDVALWIVIRRTTEAISFENYQKHMDLVLCGLDPQTGQPAKDWGESARDKHFNKLLPRRCLPYNDTDAYRLLKVATESFLTLELRRRAQALSLHAGRHQVPGPARRGRIVGGCSGRLEEVPQERQRHNGDQTLPYLALVRDKLRDERVKAAIFPVQGRDPQVGRGIRFAPGVRRHPSEQVHKSLPARADLVVLARTGNAGADPERDQPALPEHPRRRRTGSAGRDGDRPASPAEQPALELHPGRAAPAEHRPPRVRVRPPLRPVAPGQGRAEPALGRQPVEVPRGVPQLAVVVLGLLQGRRLHHGAGPTGSRRSTPSRTCTSF